MNRLFILCLILFGLLPLPVQASEGTRVFHFSCSGNGAVMMEPMIVWDGKFSADGIILNDPRRAPVQKIAGQAFYNYDGLYNKGAYKMSCPETGRKVQAVLQKHRLTITENLSGYKKSYTINIVELFDGAWDFSGNRFFIRSGRPGEWQACTGGRDPLRCRSL